VPITISALAISGNLSVWSAIAVPLVLNFIVLARLALREARTEPTLSSGRTGRSAGKGHIRSITRLRALTTMRKVTFGGVVLAINEWNRLAAAGD
jgi:hypothetical protein